MWTTAVRLHHYWLFSLLSLLSLLQVRTSLVDSLCADTDGQAGDSRKSFWRDLGASHEFLTKCTRLRSQLMSVASDEGIGWSLSTF